MIKQNVILYIILTTLSVSTTVLADTFDAVPWFTERRKSYERSKESFGNNERKWNVTVSM